jgi:thiol-disulfide isomerase/thioredoxin
MRQLLVLLAACSAKTAAPSGVEYIDAPEGADVGKLVQQTASAHAGRRLVVYVGASWCEPCQEIHHAIEQHKLDAEFPDLTLLAFDLDRDGSRLSLDGYDSELIPLFALPGPDGRASGKKEFGGKKGVDNVPLLTAKLHHLLDQK